MHIRYYSTNHINFKIFSSLSEWKLTINEMLRVWNYRGDFIHNSNSGNNESVKHLKNTF